MLVFLPALLVAAVFISSCVADADKSVEHERSLYMAPETFHEFPASFSSVVDAAETNDGNLVFLDRVERAVWSLNFEHRTRLPYGVAGSGGPGEYRRPFHLVLGSGDTVFVRDGNGYLVFSPDGAYVRNFSPPWMPTGAMMQFAGASGVAYLQAVAPTEPGVDSVAVLRWRAVPAMVDTMAMVRTKEHFTSRQSESSGGSTTNLSFSLPIPFAPQDEWVFAERIDALVIARVSPFHVEVVFSDSTSTGPVISYQRVRVSDADLPTIWPGPPPPEWMPPFGPRSVFVPSRSRIWIRLNHSIRDSLAWNVVVGADLTPIARVSLPSRFEITAVGSAFIYVVRTDEVGLRWISRVPIPEFLKGL